MQCHDSELINIAWRRRRGGASYLIILDDSQDTKRTRTGKMRRSNVCKVRKHRRTLAKLIYCTIPLAHCNIKTVQHKLIRHIRFCCVFPLVTRISALEAGKGGDVTGSSRSWPCIHYSHIHTSCTHSGFYCEKKKDLDTSACFICSLDGVIVRSLYVVFKANQGILKRLSFNGMGAAGHWAPTVLL